MNWALVMAEFRPVWDRLVPVLLHSLWQGGVAAAVLWVGLKMTPGGRPVRRYGMSLCALLAVPVMMAGTWVMSERPGLFPGGPAPLTSSVKTEEVTPVKWERKPNSPVVEMVSGFPDPPLEPQGMGWKDWVGLLWAAGAGLGLARCLFDMSEARRLRGRAVPVTNPAWLKALEEAQKTLQMNTGVVLAISDRVLVPTVVGFLRPMVLIPGFAAPGLSAEELRLILAHELAHIRRQDLWVGLFQALVEAVLFFNPALRWISRQVSLERECCCDADATRACVQGPVPYVELLAKWVTEDRLEAGRMTVAQGLAGTGEVRLPVLERVTRVLFPEKRVGRRIPIWALSAGIGAFVVLGVGAGMAAQAVAKAWTPQERVEAVGRVQKRATPEDGDYAKQPRADVVVTIVDAQGQPGLAGTSVMLHHGDPRWDGMQIKQTHPLSANVMKHKSSASAVFWVCVGQEDAGITVKGPLFGSDATGPEMDVKVEIGKGKLRTVKVMDKTGAPVKGAILMVTALVPPKGRMRLWDGIKHWKTGDDGRASFKVDSTVPVGVRVIAHKHKPGMVRLEPDGPDEVTLVMQDPEPTVGRLVWASTGEPAAGLQVGVVGYERISNGKNQDETDGLKGATHSLDSGGLVFWLETDQDGTFRVDWLEQGWDYTMCVRQRAEKALAVIEHVKPGQQLGDVLVGRAQVSGTVHDPDGLLAERKDELLVQGIYKLSTVACMDIPRRVKLTKTGPGEYSFSNLDVPANEVEFLIRTGDRDLLLQTQRFKAGENAVMAPLDVGRISREKKKATVTLALKVPEGEPVPVGVLGLFNTRDGGREIEFTASDKGEKVVTVTENEVYRSTSRTVFPGFRLKLASKRFTVLPERQTDRLELELAPAGAISGKMFQPDGRPWPAFDVKIFEIDSTGKRVDLGGVYLMPSRQRRGQFILSGLEFGRTYLALLTVQGPDGKNYPFELGPYLITPEQPVRSAELVVWGEK